MKEERKKGRKEWGKRKEGKGRNETKQKGRMNGLEGRMDGRIEGLEGRILLKEGKLKRKAIIYINISLQSFGTSVEPLSDRLKNKF